MAAFENLRLTNVGRAALTECIAEGTPLIIDRVMLGDGFMGVSDTVATMTDLVNPIIQATIVSQTWNGDGTITVVARLTSDELTTELTLREIGMFAHLDGGPEFLYMYDNAGNGPDTLPAGGGGALVDQIFKLITIIGEAANVVITIGGATAPKLFYVVDKFMSTAGQTVFTLVNTKATGALDVIIEGAVTFDFTAAGSTVTLADPLPAGRNVWVREVRASIA